MINCERFNAICLGQRYYREWLLGSVRPEGEWEDMLKMTLEMLLVCAEHTKVQDCLQYSTVLPSVVDPDLELFGRVRNRI
jgi:hypothetical protein